MTTKTVQYCTSEKLSCIAGDNVYLCLTGIVVPQIPCPLAEGITTYAQNHIEATIALVETLRGSCNFRYTFAYEDTDTSGVELVPQNIDGVICDGCMVQFVKDAVGNEPYIVDNEDGTYTFVTPHGCEYEIVTGGGSGITVTDTPSVNLTLTGSDLEADVKLSATAGNQITENADGLYVPAGGGTVNTTYLTWEPEFYTNGGPITPDSYRAWYILNGEVLHLSVSITWTHTGTDMIFFTIPPGLFTDPINPDYPVYNGQYTIGFYNSTLPATDRGPLYIVVEAASTLVQMQLNSALPAGTNTFYVITSIRVFPL